MTGRKRHFVVMGGTAIELALGFVASALVSRMLQADGRGQLGRWLYLAQLATNLGSLAIHSALPQLVGGEKLDREGAARVAALYALAAAPLGILGALCLSTLALRATADSSRIGWFVVAIAFVPATLVGYAAQGMMMARGLLVRMTVVRVLCRIAFMGGVVGMFLARVRSPSFPAIAFAAHAVLVAVALGIPARFGDPRGLERGLVRLVLRRGIVIHVSTLLMMAISLVDQGWVFTQLSDADAGLFATALGAANTLELVSYAEITASLVKMSDPVDGWLHCKRAMLRTLLVSGVGFGCGYLIAPFAIPMLYGSSFLPAVWVFRALLGAAAVFCLGRVAEAALQASGNGKASWGFQLTRAVTLLGCMLAFGRRGGLHGVTLSTMTASLVAGVATVGLAFFLGGRQRRASADVALGLGREGA